MVSLAPDVESYNFTHMYSFTDMRGTKNIYPPQPNTIYAFICQEGYSKFKKLIEKAMFISQLNNCQADFTLFAVPDVFLTFLPDEYFTTMDVGTAKQIVYSSLINRKINKKLLISSPVSYYYTLNPAMRAYITNIGGKTIVNKCVKITGFDNNCVNGLVHVVDSLIMPSEDHFMN